MTHERNTPDLVYYMHDTAAAFRFRLAGRLSHANARDLEQACRTALSIFHGRRLIVDLTGLAHVDESGRRLLQEWHSRGAELVVLSPDAEGRIQSLTALPITVITANSESCRLLPRTGRFLLESLAPRFLPERILRRLAWNPARCREHHQVMRGEM